MKIGSVAVWFPVLYLRATATYRLLPEMTPLHRILESAVKEFSRSENALAAVPIPELFLHLFGVSGALEILPGVLDDLIERGRIHRVVEDDREISTLRIIDLAPGQSEVSRTHGNTMAISENQAVQSRQIDRFIDPILEELISVDKLSSEPSKGDGFRVPAEPFLMHLTTHWVSHELKVELQDDVQIYTAVPELIGHRWRRSEAVLILKDGELAVECEDPRQSEYLRGLSQYVRRSWLLPGSLTGSPVNMAENGEDLSVNCRLPLSVEGLALTRGVPEAVLAGVKLPPSVVLVALDAAADVVEPTIVRTPDEKQAMQVAYPRSDNPNVSGIFLAGEGREYKLLPVNWEGLNSEIGVFTSAPGFRQNGTVWREVIAALETECRYSDKSELFVMLAFWLDPADFWYGLTERLASESDGSPWLDGIAEALRGLPQIVRARLSEKLPANSPLEQLRKSHHAIASLFPYDHKEATTIKNADRREAPVPRFCKRVIAFDTSSLLQYGQLIESLCSTDFLVSPQVVAAELERNKTRSEEFRIASRRNLRAIDALPKDRWTAPFHDFDLLVPGDNQNSDGAIIATLVPYCHRGLEVIVVSEDHDFVLRCRPYGIEWMNAVNFLDTCGNLKRGDKR